MSYHVCIVAADDRSRVVDERPGALTENVGPIILEAFKSPLRTLDGLDCMSVTRHLGYALGRMRAKPQHYVRLNPRNGIGNAEDTYAFLELLLVCCLEHPTCCVRVDCSVA